MTSLRPGSRRSQKPAAARCDTGEKNAVYVDQGAYRIARFGIRIAAPSAPGRARC